MLAVITAKTGGDGWESNPPRTPQQRPANGFEDRGLRVRKGPLRSVRDQSGRPPPLPPDAHAEYKSWRLPVRGDESRPPGSEVPPLPVGLASGAAPSSRRVGRPDGEATSGG